MVPSKTTGDHWSRRYDFLKFFFPKNSQRGPGGGAKGQMMDPVIRSLMIKVGSRLGQGLSSYDFLKIL